MPQPSGDQAERFGKAIINQLAAIIRTAQIHDPRNVAVLKAVDRLLEMLKAVSGDGGKSTIELLGEYFYLNDSRIKVSMEHLINFDYLVREFKKFRLGGISFTSKVTADDVQSFLKAFIKASFAEARFEALSAEVDAITSISVSPPRKEKEEEPEEVDIKKTVKNTYFNAVSFTKGVMQRIKTGEKADVKRAKRVVQSMVDLLLTQEDLLMGMTAIKDYDDYTYHHCVNVSIVSIALGQKLGFAKPNLQELGLVALFHDMGKMEVPPEILNKPASFTEDEWHIVKKHSIWGARAILKMKGFDQLSVKAAIVAFEHHVHPDGGGYPERRFPHDVDLYTRIVSLADQYDGMTSARVYSRTPMSPEKALSLMMERMGSQLDPLLFKFFVNMVGVFPVGTAVILDTKEVALVYGTNSMFADRPRVLVISDPKGRKVQGHLVDLAERSAEGAFTRSIIRTLDPAKYKINLAEYML
jgi:HD-GYP domain-containing protein (c-di-GMP phosphodiesterase class II)